VTEVIEIPDASTPSPPRPVRAAWISRAETFDEYGGSLQPLAVGLMDEVVDLVIACPQAADVEHLPGVSREVIRYAEPRWWRPSRRRVEGLAADLIGRKVEVLHALGYELAAFVERLAEEAALKYVLSGYSLSAARALPALGVSAAVVLAPSEPIRDVLLERRVCPPERIALMRPGVYHVRHPMCFSGPAASVCIVAGGDLCDEPAFEAVLKCFAELSARNMDCVYFILGGGPMERPLRRRAEELGLSGKLTVVDLHPVGQIAGVLKTADVYISPAPQPRIDIRSLLAMAAGVPVLAARGDRPCDFLHDGQTAILYSPGHASELTGKLVGLLDDRASARSQAASALRYVSEQHSPAANAARIAEIYRQAAVRR
jgi:hypothetical protein